MPPQTSLVGILCDRAAPERGAVGDKNIGRERNPFRVAARTYRQWTTPVVTRGVVELRLPLGPDGQRPPIQFRGKPYAAIENHGGLRLGAVRADSIQPLRVQPSRSPYLGPG